jgi:hypothetical protein
LDIYIYYSKKERTGYISKEKALVLSKARNKKKMKGKKKKRDETERADFDIQGLRIKAIVIGLRKR